MKRTKKTAKRAKKSTPSQTARLLVEVVDGARKEGEDEPERAREDERSEEVRGACTGAEPSWHVLENRPPEQAPGRDVRQVLDVPDEPVPEPGVVERGDVPDAVDREPDRQGHVGHHEHLCEGRPAQGPGESWGQAGDQEGRRP